MFIVICAATDFEIQPTIDWLVQSGVGVKNHELSVCLTGVGVLSTTYSLSKLFQHKKPGFAFQAGIAGAFKKELILPTTVLIERDFIADTGVEENNVFKDLFDMQLADKNKFPFTDKAILNPHINNWKKLNLPTGDSVTVGEITTRKKRIKTLQDKYQPLTESMEGAAFHYVCRQENIPFLQLRTASNYIGERDKTKWQLQPAIADLNKHLIRCIELLTK